MNTGLSLSRRKPRWMVIFVVVSMLTALSASVVQANLSPSTFEGNDGNQVHLAGTDWDNVAGKTTAPDKAPGKTDNSFGQGTKEDSADVTVVTGAIPPNKNDLSSFLEASETIGTDTYLYLGWTRLVNIGNANLDFEINQATTPSFTATATGKITLNRTAGDVLITYDFGGSGTPTLGYRTWTGSAWSAGTVLTSANSEGAVSANGLFGEASINLSGAGIFPPGTCESFGSTFLKSRSSSSFTAELKDFIAPVPVNISNCGTVIIRKATDPAGGTGFPFTSNVATNPADSSNASFSLDDGDSKTMENVTAGTYNVTETVANIGNYTLTGIDCSAGDIAPTTSSTATGAVTFTIGAGDTLDCTYTNTENKATPALTSAPSVIPQDKATISGLDATGDGGDIHFELWNNSTCDGTQLYDETQAVTASGDYVTNNPGDTNPASLDGYTIKSSTTVYWAVSYDGDSRNDPFDLGCTESIAVTLDNDTTH